MELVAKKRVQFKSALGGKPGYGEIGRKTQVYVNHFPVTLPNKGIIYHYDIDLKEQGSESEQPTAGKAGTKKKQPPSPKQSPPPKLGAAGDANVVGDAINKAKQKEDAKIPKRLKRDIISYWQEQNAAFFSTGNVIGVYDGEKNFFTFKKLPLVQAEEKEFPVKVKADVEEGRRAKVFILTVKLVKLVPVDVLHKVISDPGREFPTNVLAAFQCVMREALSRWCPAPGLRTFFFPENGFDLGTDRAWSPKQAWPGIFMSLRPNLWKVTLNLDVSHTALSKEQPFVEYYAKYMKNATKRYNFEGTDVLVPAQHSSVPDHHRKAAEREVYGLKVQTNYSGIRRWRCSGFSAKSLKDLEFTLTDGKKQKVVDYFRQQYKLDLEHLHLPAVQVGPKNNPKYLPITHCIIMGGQKMGRKLAEEEVSTMVRSCAKPACERKRQIESIRTSPVTTIDKQKKNPFEQKDNPFLKEFGISVASKMPLSPARVLPMPFVGGKTLYNVKPDEATLDIPRDAKFIPYKGIPLTTEWALINLSRERRLDNQALNRFIGLLCSMGRDRMGTFPSPKNASTAGEQINSRDFIKHYENLKKNVFQNKRPQLLVVIVPKKGCGEYATCKQYFDVVEGVKTQMVAADSVCKNLERGLPMYISNLLLKINAKLNGSNQMVAYSKMTPQIQNLPGLKRLLGKPTMVFGADVTHPSAGMSAATPSIAAVTASVDKFFGEYRARVRAQVHREEIIQDMEQVAMELFGEFKKVHKCYPHHIVLFRDGVSEGQMNQVWMNEVNALQNACKKIGGDIGKPGITYVIVGKRHHTRLFAEKPADAVGRAGNVPPGTIVDSSICHYAELDYYLCSHFGLQGTSRPAHYHVLCDDNDLDVDSLQLLSYYLCYVYQRCLRAVSMPAPAYYAHHVAFRARHHLSRLFNDMDSNDSPLSTPERRAQMQAQLAAYNKEILLHGEVLNTQYFC